ncbi:MAG: GNAT family N-acetyltransferase [Acidobacteria bacterium]|nr:GNAT family N-acetyltransferase [Acidobacteriota bacterium]
MGLDARLIEEPEEIAALGPAWDELAEGRGGLADIFDSYAWFAAWRAADPENAARTRLAVAFAGGRPVALLPVCTASRWRGEAPGMKFRPRFRPLVAASVGPGEALGTLLDIVARSGARTLGFPAMPTRDPVTGALGAALRACGYAVTERTGTNECFTPAQPSWPEHAREFRKYDRTVKNFSNKSERIAPLSEAWHTAEPGLGEAFETYVAVHARGWKGPLREPMRRFRRELLHRAAERGWARLFVLRAGDLATAAMIWFRLGEVAIAYSTVYDERLSALSPGTIAMWRAHQRVFEDNPPRLVDYLPGSGSQKDQLGTEHPPLVSLEAARGGSLGMALSRVSRAAPVLRDRLRVGGGPATSAQDEGPALHLVAQPGAGTAATLLEVEPTTELYLAVCGSHRSAKAMNESWEEGDSWWRVGDPPRALVRVGQAGEPRPVRELVLVEAGDVEIGEVLAAVAAGLGGPVIADLSPSAVHRAPLPWPAGDR